MLNTSHRFPPVKAQTMSTSMQLAQEHLDLTHACMISADQALTACRTSIRTLALEHAQSGEGDIYRQRQRAKRENVILLKAFLAAELISLRLWNLSIAKRHLSNLLNPTRDKLSYACFFVH